MGRLEVDGGYDGTWCVGGAGRWKYYSSVVGKDNVGYNTDLG